MSACLADQKGLSPLRVAKIQKGINGSTYGWLIGSTLRECQNFVTGNFVPLAQLDRVFGYEPKG